MAEHTKKLNGLKNVGAVDKIFEARLASRTARALAICNAPESIESLFNHFIKTM